MTITAPHPTAADISDVHGGIECADVEALLTEISARADALQMTADSPSNDYVERLHHLMDDLQKSLDDARSQVHTLTSQVDILTEELISAEKAATPAGALVSAHVTRDHIVATYRATSRHSRGPLPLAVEPDVISASEEIIAAMDQAAHATLQRIIRRTLRRRARTR